MHHGAETVCTLFICTLESVLIIQVYEIFQKTTVFLRNQVNNIKAVWRVMVTKYPHITTIRCAPQFQIKLNAHQIKVVIKYIRGWNKNM